MKVVDIQPKDVHVTLELSVSEIGRFLDFCEKAMPLYAKVYKDSDASSGDYVAEEIALPLKDIFDDIKKGVGHGS